MEEMVNVPVSQIQELCRHCTVEQFTDLSVSLVVTVEENVEVVRFIPFQCTVEEMADPSGTGPGSALQSSGHGTAEGVGP